MAIPTDFKGPTPAAGTTKTWKLFGSTTVGQWVMDIDGTLAAATKVITLGPNLAIVTGVAYTDAEIIPLVKDWLARMGAYHEGAGGQAAETTKQILVTAQTTS
nr:MetaGeneMark_Unknown Function [uncultured bacterium]